MKAPVFRPAGLGPVKTRAEIDRDYTRANRDHPDRAFRRTRDWRDRIRPRQLAVEPLCRVCREAGRVTEATQVDHIRVPNGDVRLQRDPGNLQSICATCHSLKTREDQRARKLAEYWETE
jgi:5-methylcytosine-specific restriction endonuclease McrA